MKARLAYQAGSSLIHRLHPLIKMAWLILLTGLVFLFQGPGFSLVVAVALLVSFPLIGKKLTELRGFRILLLTAGLICVLQIVFMNSGEVMLQSGAWRITREGLARGLYLGARFLDVILLSYLFVLTTSPSELAYALMQAGLPYRFGFTFVIALRLIPLFEEEAMIVYRAQQVRGVSYRKKNPIEFWRNIQAFLLPLLISAMSKVEALSISMEGRCYGRYKTRTFYKVRETTRIDWLAGVALALVGAAAVMIKIWEG